MSQDRTYSIMMQTRDCECDLQGIINNAVYLNYLEHTRHCFLRHLGVDFRALHIEGIDAVVRRIEIDYRLSLKGMEEFSSSLRMSTKGRLQYVFDQKLRRQPDNAEVVSARTYVAFVTNGRPVPPPEQVISAVNDWFAGVQGEISCM
ncbi:MAG: acyl-CoA thioesterase [Spirochaetales bacterium]|nr:acyl-CoA thioesterase [Spirochaetales bacterium]